LFAKPRRMFAMTVACLVAAAAPVWPVLVQALAAGAVVIAAGSAVTCIGRTRRLAKRLRDRAATSSGAAGSANAAPSTSPARDDTAR
jgi:uncharacterized protein (DUF2062 family)